MTIMNDCHPAPRRPHARRLAASALALCAASAFAQQPPPACRIDEAQRLLGQPAGRPQAQQLLAQCAIATPGDWHVFWLQGVLARDDRQLPEARALLEKALALAGDDPAPALDLAVVHEWSQQPAEARGLYERVLRIDPTSRAARLGLARVARAQNRDDEARAIYDRLLEANPRDLDALNGLGWIDLSMLHLTDSRRHFEAVRAIEPGNAEAALGLERLGEQWRYRLDVTAGRANLAAGRASTAGADLLINLSDVDQVEIAAGRNSRELPVERLTDPTPLPSWTSRLGYRSQFSNGLQWGAAYEYREREATPAEQRIELRLSSRFPGAAQRLQWFAGVRQSFGGSWHGRLATAGLAYDLAPAWSVAATYFAGHDPTAGDSHAIAFDVYRDMGGTGSFLNLGVGYSPDPSNTSVHARIVWPVAQLQAILFSIERRSLGSETEASLGWRFYWR